MSERLTDEDSRILWEAIGAQSASVVTVRAVERIVEAHVAEALAPVYALADEWECEPPRQHPEQYRHRETCPACSLADALRAAAGTPTRDTTEEDA